MLRNIHSKAFIRLARRLQTAGDARRLAILCVLFRDKKSCVSDIAGSVNASVAVTSHHLQALAKEGLVVPVREGKRVCYALSPEEFSQDLRKFICRYK
jgi:DNA-binding transcriptional ArsR family regulator